MTVKYDVMKKYHKGKDLEVTASSVVDFNAGNRDTIDHRVMYESLMQIVSIKPPVRDYSHYRICQDRLRVIPFPEDYFGGC